MDVKNAIINYLYSERIKSELIIASKLLQTIHTFDEEEIPGAKRILTSFFEALSSEIGIARNIIESKDFIELEGKIMEIIGRVEMSQFLEANECVSKAISRVTTSCSDSMSILIENDLI